MFKEIKLEHITLLFIKVDPSADRFSMDDTKSNTNLMLNYKVATGGDGIFLPKGKWRIGSLTTDIRHLFHDFQNEIRESMKKLKIYETNPYPKEHRYFNSAQKNTGNWFWVYKNN